MTETHVGRLLAATLHQALADELPDRLEFYENLLHSEGLRDGTIGMARISGVAGFLRAEGDAYGRVVARAGALAAEWAVASMPAGRRRMVGWLPRRLRARAALRIASSISRTISRQTSVSRRIRGTSARLQITGSVFCASRAAQRAPLCGFYAALAARTLQLFGMAAVARAESCRSVDGSPCVVTIDLTGAAADGTTAIAA